MSLRILRRAFAPVFRTWNLWNDEFERADRLAAIRSARRRIRYLPAIDELEAREMLSAQPLVVGPDAGAAPVETAPAENAEPVSESPAGEAPAPVDDAGATPAEEPAPPN